MLLGYVKGWFTELRGISDESCSYLLSGRGVPCTVMNQNRGTAVLVVSWGHAVSVGSYLFICFILIGG